MYIAVQMSVFSTPPQSVVQEVNLWDIHQGLYTAHSSCRGIVRVA